MAATNNFRAANAVEDGKIGQFGMDAERVARWRKEAERCRVQAASSTFPPAKDQWIRMAERYERLVRLGENPRSSAAERHETD